MRLKPFAAAFLAVCLAGAAPVPAGSHGGSDVPAFSPDRFRAHVTFLADDLLEGRDTGSRGHEIAASYVASQFIGLGLTPGGENGSWYEQVPFRSATLDGPVSLSISGPSGNHSFENGTDAIVGPSLAEEQQDIVAPIVFAGHGIDAPAEGVDDYKGLDVRGKFVAILSGVPKGLPSEIAAHLGDDKGDAAARHGAIGLITLYVDPARPFAMRAGAIRRPSISWVGKDGKEGRDAPGLRASMILGGAAADALFAGAPYTYSEIRTADAKDGHVRGFPLATTLHLARKSAWTSFTSPEVIGLLPGSDPKLRGEYVVLMGHLDHLGMRKDAKPGEDAIYNGALDNAAGVATMLEAAHAFAESGQRPRRSILFIANTGEEKGLLGADYFAHYPTVPAGRIAAVVDLDMPLLLYHFTDVIAFGAGHSQVAETVARAAGEMGVALSPDPMPEENIFVRSDHYEFVKQGIPAITLATGFANGGAEKWKAFLRGAYHHPNDDLSQPIDWESGARFAKLNYLISRDLANADHRPLWYKGDYFADLFAPDAPRATPPARLAGGTANGSVSAR
ncbi:MAG TPA: M28 family metallopeptidase [Allosphingosinicella sp.]|nr:M28 family metallopeptidase [Allosphingosinicella sp.]